MFVIGTAGHVDHGKTSLIEALTGIDADRLPEEKRRGLTIDLGFAHFQGPDGQPVGVIDVPGHERFIRNMVAGAWSLECGLLTVAADDGWMQQSTDHTRVLRAMGVPRLILVVTKTDIADKQRVEEVRRQGLAQCRRLGYPTTQAVAVSASTGENIEELRAMILSELAGLRAEGGSVPPPGAGYPFVYVDRVFTVQGAGAVVTGSLAGGELRRGAELELLPQRRRVRVRSIQAYYVDQEAVRPVCRVALNLAGHKSGEIRRGSALCVPGAPVWAGRELIVRLVPGEEDEALQRTIHRHGEAEIAIGTGHYRARLHPLEAPGLVYVVVEGAVPLRWNEPLVFIRHGGSVILGAGRVLWPEPTSREERRRIAAELDLTSATAVQLPSPPRLKLAIRGYLHAGELAQPQRTGETGSAEPETPAPTEAGPAGVSEVNGRTARRGDWVLLASTLRDLEARIRSLADAPGGLAVAELASRFGLEAEMLLALCNDLVERGELSLRAGVLFPKIGAEASLSPMGRQLLGELRAARASGLQVDRLKALGAAKQMRALARAGLAVSLDGNIYLARETYFELVGRILQGLAQGERFSIAAAKERSGLSRKYIIPLLNRMEDDGMVRRDGDQRVVIGLPEAASDARTSGREAE